MSAAGGIVLIGSITLANQIANTTGEVDWVRIPVATAIMAFVVDTIDKAGGREYTKWLVGIAAVTAMIAPLGGRPSPVETAYRLFGRTAPIEKGSNVP